MSKGDIGSLIDFFVFDTGGINNSNIIHIAGDIFAVVYRDGDDTGDIVTVDIDKDGVVDSGGSSIIASLEFEDTWCEQPKIIQVSGTTYLIVYAEVDQPGETVGRLHAVTVTINPDGTLGSTVIDTLVVDSGLCFECEVLHISGDVYAVVYRGPGSDGWLVTFTVTAQGAISNTVTDTLEFDTSSGFGPSIVLVSGTIYAIVYQSLSSSIMQVVTVDIQDDGQIAAAVTDSGAIGPGGLSGGVRGVTHYVLKIGGTTYAFGHRGTGGDGFLHTFSITDAGTIGALIETSEFDTDNAAHLKPIKVTGDLYAIAYQGSGADGFLVTLRIHDDGRVGSVLNSLEFDTTSAKNPIPLIIPRSDGIFVIAYVDGTNRGVLRTARITTLLAGYIWIEKEAFHYIDENALERFVIGSRDDHAAIEAVYSWMGL